MEIIFKQPKNSITKIGSGGNWMGIEYPVRYCTLSGRGYEHDYDTFTRLSPECFKGTLDFCEGGYSFRIIDIFSIVDGSGIVLERSVKGRSAGMGKMPEGVQDGIRFELSLSVPSTPEQLWRFCLPSIRYTKLQKLEDDAVHTFMEDRLTGNLVAAYNSEKGSIYSVSKLVPAARTQEPYRVKGQNRYIHRTENGSLGYRTTKSGSLELLAYWPYYEGEQSVALDALNTAASAYYPLDGKEIDIKLCYAIECNACKSFSEGVFEKFKGLAYALDKQGQKIVGLPFTLEQSMEFRLASLAKTYREFGKDGAGYLFHFDPTKGYGTPPSGFGTSFNTIPHESYIHILEYGFTGRQLNAALIMAKRFGGEWCSRGKRVIDFFIKNCITPNGWMFSLFDLERNKPFYSHGDPDAPKLHYISRTNDRGNYLRTMVEPAYDILQCYRWYRLNGMEEPAWLEKVLVFADFLVKAQNADGSWYRVYRPNGEAAETGGDEELPENERELGKKAATAIPIDFLCSLCELLKDLNLPFSKYEKSAIASAEYTMNHSVVPEHYQGGTLDNPNVVDKEAVQYVMAGLYALYQLTGRQKYLEGAESAAKLFITWNYIWNAPTQPDTYLHEKNFKTKGNGAINSIWGGGVVDIYSLFHIRELYQIGCLSGEEFLCTMAHWIAIGTQQILSHTGDAMGFADTGMQPEGFGICNQGIDEGLISKGDIWGTLGWIYSAGIYGMGRYLEARNGN